MRSASCRNAFQALPHKHPGDILAQAQTQLKPRSKNNPGVYFLQSRGTPGVWNIGHTKRDKKARLRDAGSKGWDWDYVTFREDIIENEIHDLLEPWRNTVRPDCPEVFDFRIQVDGVCPLDLLGAMYGTIDGVTE